MIARLALKLVCALGLIEECSAAEFTHPTIRDFLSAPAEQTKLWIVGTEEPEKGLLKLTGGFEKFRTGAGALKYERRFCFALEKSTDLETKAIWALRTYLLLATLGFEKAHSTDSEKDSASARGAIAWLLKSLGDYRFERVDREYFEDCFAYEFVHASNAKKRIVAVWKPSGEPHTTRLYNDPFKIIRAEQMPLGSAPPESVEVKQEIEGYMALQVSETPILIWLEE